MNSTRFVITKKSIEQVKADLLGYCVPEKKRGTPQVDPSIQPLVDEVTALGDFKGKKEESILLYPPADGTLTARRVILVGIGKDYKKEENWVLRDELRKVGGMLAGTCEKTKAATLALVIPEIPGLTPEQAAQGLVEGISLGDYRFVKYRETKKKSTDYTGIKTVQVLISGNEAAVRRGIKKGQTAARAACDARDMANEPGNGWTSGEFAAYAKQLADEYGFKYDCFEKETLEKLGMGGILGVNQGSAVPPRMVILEYQPENPTGTLLLVGKGITFDSGGISIKPGAGMEEMKYDMCGGAAVLTTMKAVGEEKPDVRVIAIVPATDNMSGSGAIHPGDIIRHYNGVTAEIINTDAEGRMILGDALSYGVETYKPDAVIDIATLTGAVIIGLGHHFTGLLGNNDKLAQVLLAAGKDAGEPLWQLPLTEDFKKQIKSDVADIKNVGGRPGGTITAAAYLSHFVGDTPWAHLDIAGTAWDYTKKSYIPKGPSGIAVRTFISLIRNWKKGMI